MGYAKKDLWPKRRVLSTLRIFTALLLAAAFAIAACTGESAREKKVLVIGIDGVRPDVLPQLETPNIDALIADGCYTGAIKTGAQTISGPGWSSMLIGAWPEKHLVVLRIPSS